MMLYNANADTFTVARKDFASLSGAYAASSYDHFIVDNKMLNSSLVAEKTLDVSTGSSSGFSFVDDFAFRTTSTALSSAGVIQRVDMSRTQSIRPTRMIELPLITTPAGIFTRTLAPLYSRNAIASLTTSGVTLLSWNYDAAVAPPRISKVVNAADLQKPVAPGGLISVFGDQLSPLNIATREIPLPTALADSCLTVKRSGRADAFCFQQPDQCPVAVQRGRKRHYDPAHTRRRERQLQPAHLAVCAQRVPQWLGGARHRHCHRHTRKEQ